MPLIGDKGAVENYGNILSGTFKSKKLVIDKKCPEIAGLKLEKADKLIIQMKYIIPIKNAIQI